jgi:hypothetical protein
MPFPKFSEKVPDFIEMNVSVRRCFRTKFDNEVMAGTLFENFGEVFDMRVLLKAVRLGVLHFFPKLKFRTKMSKIKLLQKKLFRTILSRENYKHKIQIIK